jgi:ABC-2 type transport system permease protein
MKTTLIIAYDEWRYWRRSNLALCVIGLFIFILVSVSLLTAYRIQVESHERLHHQEEAEQTFQSQPDRHPHRMVHYGHYVFRTPTPLAMFDPGLDSVTGQSMFLEGHRQNSAAFSASLASADMGALSWLTPALVYQLLAPLLILLLGHGAVVREREAGALAPLLAQGISGRLFIMGKALALLSFVVVLLIPIAVTVLFAVGLDDGLLSAVSLIGVYLFYLCIWAVLALLVSVLFRERSSVIAVSAALWLGLSLVLPALAVNMVSVNVPLTGKIEVELKMLAEEQDLSDGHNVSDSSFDQLKANLLQQQGVEHVEDLDVNIRGIVSLNAEEQLTEKMNLYAEERMATEKRQANSLASYGWLNPVLALAAASRSLSGTDIEHYHRFLRQAEQLRYDFVQGLNQVHAEQLSYTDDINRSRDEASNQLTRMDASNWQLLEGFRFEPASAAERLTEAAAPIRMLCVWLVSLCMAIFWVGGRLKP